MNNKLRSQYANYLSDAIRYAMKETKVNFPKKTIIVAKSYTPLAEIDEIIGMKIYVMDMPSSFEFFIAFPAENTQQYKLQKAFLEYIELYSLED